MRRLLWFPLALVGCGSATPAVKSSPAGAPPREVTAPARTPRAVTRAEPGGDAADPHAAALDRLLREPFGERRDKDDQLLVTLPDSENWKRVRYFGVEHFLGFRYGEDHHAMVIVFVQDTPEEQPSSQDCTRKFEAWGRPQIKGYQVEFKPFQLHFAKFFDKPLYSISVDGTVNLGFSRSEFSAGWAAYAYYPRACLVAAVAVPWRHSPALAQRVRDRFLKEAFLQTKPLTPTRPYRR